MLERDLIRYAIRESRLLKGPGDHINTLFLSQFRCVTIRLDAKHIPSQLLHSPQVIATATTDIDDQPIFPFDPAWKPFSQIVINGAISKKGDLREKCA